MKHKHLTLSLFAAAVVTTAVAEEFTLDPIVVGADFREHKLSQTTGSVSVITEDKIADRVTQPFAEMIASVPNVNFSSGASRAKYIQIRGMGERGQFETPINPTVGLIVDGIDFSNIPLGISLYDVKQIEVLRGPQGTTFGANALAGVVFVESNDPTEETEAHMEASVGNYNTKAFGATVSGALIKDKLLGRLSVYKNSSDGYFTNTYLNRDDTNNIDELTAKAKLKWYVSDKHMIDLTLLHIDVDNGYDAFNEKSTYYTESDNPGKDKQKTNAFAVRSNYQLSKALHLESLLSYSNSDTEYSYDEDWTAGRNYSSTDEYLRDKEQLDIDIRFVSDETGKIFKDTTDWVAGVYYKHYKSDLTRNYTGWDASWNTVPKTYTSQYKTTSYAAYGQFDIHINQALKGIVGLRAENWKTDFSDSDSYLYDDTEMLTGGKVGLSYDQSSNSNFYVTLSRGYKPGGFNPVPDFDQLPKHYKSEVLWNVDFGMNSTYINNTLQSKINFFYGKRKDHQVGTSYNKTINGITKYNDYITNAEESIYYGLEAELDYQPAESLNLYANLGLLRAKFDKFYNEVDGVSKDGRTPAQSPKYQYNVGFDYTFLENWILRANVEGMGSYYFSNTHDMKSKPYALTNASITYAGEQWTATLWGRNLTDKEYDTRGYFFDNFGNGDELYTQKGAPRTFGFTLSYDF